MWDRIILKQRGKAAFQRNYWRCVLVAFILMIIAGGTGNSARREVQKTQVSSEWEQEGAANIITDSISGVVAAVTAVAFLVIMGVMLLLGILVFNPLEIGGCRFFMENAYEPSMPGQLLFAFKNGYYGNAVLGMFLRDLYTFLWGLLFVIPGIIKSYEYRMVPYLLADCPEMNQAEAFRLSKELMYGQKMDAFVLDLSFFGWNILSACTCGLLGIFFVNPYQHATNAELFLELKRQYFAHQNTL